MKMKFNARLVVWSRGIFSAALFGGLIVSMRAQETSSVATVSQPSSSFLPTGSQHTCSPPTKRAMSGHGVDSRWRNFPWVASRAERRSVHPCHDEFRQ